MKKRTLFTIGVLALALPLVIPSLWHIYRFVLYGTPAPGDRVFTGMAMGLIMLIPLAFTYLVKD